MFSILKMIVWSLGSLVLAYFVLVYLGYEINLNYFTESKEKCQERIKECTNNLVRQGIDNVKCDYNCVNPDLIIKNKKIIN